MIPENEPTIKREDGTPTLANQCAAKGWGFGFYDFGKGEQEGVTYFNPGCVQRDDGLWLIVRRSENAGTIFGMNKVWAFLLDDEGKTPKKGHLLEWPESQHNQQYEDARAFYHPRLKQTGIGATSFIWHDNGSWTGAHQVFGFFDSEWQCKIKHDPVFGGNTARLEHIPDPKNYEKSWLWFLNNGKLCLLYKAKPWVVAEFGETWEDVEVHHNAKGLTWRFGEIRNGTPPVLVDGLFYSFFHSSLPWKGNYRRYYMGALTFEPEPPYKIVGLTPEPLLAGSQNDIWQLRKPPCVFPCGAILRSGKWLVTLGVNDLKAGWVELEHASLIEHIKPVEKSVTPIMPPTGLSKEEQRKATLRANMAKAREAKALKKLCNAEPAETGTEKPAPKRRKKRRARRIVAAVAAVFMFGTCQTQTNQYLRKDGTYAVKGDSFRERW